MPWGPLQVEIVGRMNLGTVSKPIRGYKLERVDRKGTCQSFSGELTNAQGRYRVRAKPEYDGWVELIPLDGQGPPSIDVLDTIGEERD